MESSLSDFIVNPLAAAAITKGAVDVIRINFPRANAAFAVLCAVVVGQVSSFVLLYARGTAVSAQTIAQAVLQGMLATLTAVGANRLGNKAQEVAENGESTHLSTRTRRRATTDAGVDRRG